MEQYSFHCPACGVERTAPLKIVGRRIRCPACDATVVAPDPNSQRERQLQDKWAPPPADSEPEANVPPFDPYYKWLAIPPSEQPPNHYRLLGLPLFEEDREVIESSADRQMGHVKTQAAGRRAELSQKLLNELANACSCLMSPRKKKAYDKRLRQELEEKANQDSVATRPQQDKQKKTRRQEPKQKSTSKPAPSSSKRADAPASVHPSEGTRRGAAAGREVDIEDLRLADYVSEKPPRRRDVRPTIEAAEEKSQPRKRATAEKGDAPTEARSRGEASEPIAAPPVQTPGAAPPVQAALGDATAAGDEPPDEEDGAAVVFGKDRDRPEAEMDMTPMVDVVFLLLIFFMVTAAFALQRSKELPIPKEDQPSTAAQSIEDFEEDPDVIIVRVDAYNSYHVTTPDWEEEAPSKQELLIKLREARQGDSAGNVPTQLLVIANGEALYERVITALDAGPAVGMESVKMLTVEEDE